MSDVTETTAERPTGLALMREPFAKNQISKLPKPTRRQTDELKSDRNTGIRCGECGQWHHRKVVHLDYVGHAALTDRLLDCDPGWNWAPVHTDEHGKPVFDRYGGMWINLTVCGVTRLGYGDALGKEGGNAIKEVIGDALRNAAMRFGAALDLWHKGELHVTDDDMPPPKPQTISEEQFTELRDLAEKAGVTEGAACEFYSATSFEEFPLDRLAEVTKKLNTTIASAQNKRPPAGPDAGDGETIPYEGPQE